MTQNSVIQHARKFIAKLPHQLLCNVKWPIFQLNLVFFQKRIDNLKKNKDDMKTKENKNKRMCLEFSTVVRYDGRLLINAYI